MVNLPLQETGSTNLANSSAGLHGCLFNLTRDELTQAFARETPGGTAYPSPTLSQQHADGLEVIAKLKQSFSARSIDAVADDYIEKYGGNRFRGLKSALNAWRTCWDHRKFGDIHSDGRSFHFDPLPHWHLAKLLIVLYLSREVGVDQGPFEIPRCKLGDSEPRTLAQEKLVLWVHKLRRGEKIHNHEIAPAGLGPRVMREDGSRILLIMEHL